MLKALDELERAVGRLVERASGKASDGLVSKGTEASVVEATISRAARQPDQINEEAAELIKRAIKRLKSL
jgi:hypothetical protein